MNFLKKTVAVLLGTCMLFAMASCSKIEQNYKKAGAEWAIDAYKMLPAEFNEDTCNQFWVGGDVYEFPMKAEEFFDNGWEIIDIYQEEVNADYLLDPESVYELGLKKNLGPTALTMIFNSSDEPKAVSECMVIYVAFMWNDEVLLPGGALLSTKYKTLDEAMAAFNDDMTEFDAENNIYGYEFEAEDWEFTCSVRLSFEEAPNGIKVRAVKFYAVDADLLEQNKIF